MNYMHNILSTRQQRDITMKMHVLKQTKMGLIILSAITLGYTNYSYSLTKTEEIIKDQLTHAKSEAEFADTFLANFFDTGNKESITQHLEKLQKRLEVAKARIASITREHAHTSPSDNNYALLGLIKTISEDIYSILHRHVHQGFSKLKTEKNSFKFAMALSTIDKNLRNDLQKIARNIDKLHNICKSSNAPFTQLVSSLKNDVNSIINAKSPGLSIIPAIKHRIACS
jgi:DNA-binding phage protein